MNSKLFRKTAFLVLIACRLCAQVPTNGLSGWWPFDGNANDLSSAGNHGTVYGATLTTDRFGAPGKAYHFDGNDYIVMLTAGNTGSVSRSVSFWSRSSNSDIQVAYGYGEADSPGGIYQVVYNYSCPGVGFDNSQSAYIRSNNLVSDGSWHHVAVVYDSGLGSQIGNIKIFVDTVLQTTIGCAMGPTTSVVQSNSIYPVTIGRSSNSGLRFFIGDLDDFFEYNRALNYSEVQQLYHDRKCAIPKPVSTGAIAGSATVCLGSTNMYSVAPVNNATFYNWYIPGGWQGSSTSNTILLQANVAGGNISVAAGNSCGTSSYTTRFVNTGVCTSIVEEASSIPEVFPNPSSGIFMLANLPTGSEIRLSNLVGQNLVSSVFLGDSQIIDCRDLESGIYIVTVYSGGVQVWTKKLVKN